MARLLMLMAIACAWSGRSHAEVRLPPIFSDHMVLAGDETTAIWGKAEPGEAVTISIGDRQAVVQADATGAWLTRLALTGLGAGPFELTVTGQNTVRIRDVLIGEVWLASGQSNMQFAMRGDKDAADELAKPANPLIRHFKIELSASLDPLEECRGEWVIADPEHLPDFTAVGYYFAQRLQAEMSVPIGLINASWGGTAIESWISPDALRAEPEYAPAIEERLQAARAYPKLIEEYRVEFARWLEESGRGDRRLEEPSVYAGDEIAVEAWQPIMLPLSRQAEAPGVPGALWFRRRVEIGERQAGKQGILVLGDISGFEEVYWNGRLVGATRPEELPGSPYARQIVIPADLVGSGAATLAIRVFNPSASPSLVGRVLKLGALSLAGEWLTRQEYAIPELVVRAAPRPPAALSHPQGLPGAIFNGMIHPIVPFSIRGVIWYQGESNATRAWRYRTLFPMLIENWRRHWNTPSMPFYYCQLANYGPKLPEPAESNWAELREAQGLALSLPHTGQAVLIDIGEAGNIHPWNKQAAGERLARIALAKSYGRELAWSGPTWSSRAVEDGKMRIGFEHTDGGLVAHAIPATHDVYIQAGRRAPLLRNSPTSQLEGFAICGVDQKWVWAEAEIDGDSVLVWSDKVAEPVAVRYGWADNPTVNLYNGSGLPASPFRTDSFTLRTFGLR